MIDEFIDKLTEIVREPDGVDFVVSSGRWSPEVSAEVAEFLRQLREQAMRSPTTVAREPADGEVAIHDGSDRNPVATSS